MTSPRNPPDRSEDSGATRVSEVVERGRQRWAWAQRLRPVRTYLHFSDVGGVVLSGGMSYQALFAVFAALWLGFGIFGIVLRGRPELLDSIVAQINLFIPGLVGTGGAVSIDELMSARAFDWSSAIAGLVLVWVALNWFTGTRRSIRIIFGLEVRLYRNPVLLKLRDFVLAIIFFAAILVSAALTVLSSNLADHFLSWIGASETSWFVSTLGTVVRYAAVYAFDIVLLVAMHRYLAEVRVPRARLIVGCGIGALVLLGLKALGGVLIGGATSNPLLATFAVFAGLLLWFNLICRTLLLTSSWIATGLDPELGRLPERAAV